MDTKQQFHEIMQKIDIGSVIYISRSQIRFPCIDIVIHVTDRAINTFMVASIWDTGDITIRSGYTTRIYSPDDFLIYSYDSITSFLMNMPICILDHFSMPDIESLIDHSRERFCKSNGSED